MIICACLHFMPIAYANISVHDSRPWIMGYEYLNCAGCTRFEVRIICLINYGFQMTDIDRTNAIRYCVYYFICMYIFLWAIHDKLHIILGWCTFLIHSSSYGHFRTTEIKSKLLVAFKQKLTVARELFWQVNCRDLRIAKEWCIT